MNAEINQVRTELLNVMAEAGRAALHFDTLGAAALAAIPNTEPQQYVIAGTAPMIAKLLPAVDVGSAVSTAVGESVATAAVVLTDERIGNLWESAIEQFQRHERGISVHPSIYLTRAIERELAAHLAAPTQAKPADADIEKAASAVESYGLTELAERLRSRVAAPTQVSAPTDELKQLRNRVSQLEAARIGYASEFPLNADGEPDVGNIHANIRALKAQVSAPQASAAQEVRAVPEDVRRALGRMCTPLDESRLSGATAAEDARCMGIIRRHIESTSTAPAAPSLDWQAYHSTLSKCAELLDNMADGDSLLDVPAFLSRKLKELGKDATPVAVDEGAAK